MTAALAVAASIGFLVQATPSGEVQGRVLSAETGAPLRGAVVTLVPPHRTVVTDGQGRYRLSDLPAGEAQIRATRIGYAPLQVVVTVPEGARLSVDFLLPLDPVEMPAVSARTGAAARTDSTGPRAGAMAPGTAVIRLLEASPGVAETGITAAAQALLGVDPPVPDNILYVRGAGTALDLVLLDGAPVHAPFHLGGLLDPGLPPAVAVATRYQGGASARFDGGLSDVLRLETAPAGAMATASAFVDLLSAGASFQAPVPGGGVRGGARVVHAGGTGPFVDGAFPQKYGEVLGRADVGLTARDSLRLTGFWNRESLVLSPRAGGADSPEWGNGAGGIRYRRGLDGGVVDVGVALGEFRTRLPIGEPDPVVADGRTRRLRVTADAVHDLEAFRVGYGAHLDRLGVRTTFQGRSSGGDTLSLVQNNSAVDLAAYVDGEVRLTPAVRVAAGLRGSVFSGRLGQSVSPRARLELVPAGDLKVIFSAGRFHQLVAATDSLPAGAALVTATDGPPLGSTFTRINVAEATHVVMRIGYEPPHATRLALEGYWKTTGGLPALGDATVENAGFDIWLRKETKRVQMWGTYSMAWAWAESRGIGRTEIFSGRHFLRGGVATEMMRGIRVEGDVAFGAGLEFGVIPRPAPPTLQAGGWSILGETETRSDVVPAPGAVRPPRILVTVPRGAFLRLNFAISGRFDTDLLGRPGSVHPYLRIINALDRPDALFYEFDRDSGAAPRAVGAIPLLPVVGVEWRM